MRFSRARYVTLCQQSLVTAAVLAVGLSAAGVKTLDIVPQPGATSGAEGKAPVNAPEASGPNQVLSEGGDDHTEVDTAPVTPKVREVAVTSAPRKATARQALPEKAEPKAAEKAGEKAGEPTPRTVESTPQKVTGYATIGVTWAHGVTYAEDQIKIEVRTLKHGAWSGWSKVQYHDDHGPDSASGEEESARERPGTDALVIGDVDEVQMRTTTADGSVPPDLKLALIDPGTGKMTTQAPAIDTAKLASAKNDQPEASGQTTLEGDGVSDDVSLSAMVRAPKPKIYSRAQWGANEKMREQTPPDYGTVKTGFVHHTVNANNYSAAQVPALLRGIYAYHTQSRGWRDIGYNYLVDRFGRIWEGRYGGVDRAVVGAHTLGYNEVSFAMSAIGNFDIANPPQAVLDAYARLFAWKLSIYNISATQTNILVKGRRLNAINGHRDVGQTACPGRYLYAKIPWIRTKARAIQVAAQKGGGSTPTPTPTPPFSPTAKARAAVKQPSTLTFPRSLNQVGAAYPDLVLRDSAGVVKLLATGGQDNYGVVARTAGRWSKMNLLTAVNDVTGDGKGDVLGRTGTVTRVYPGDGKGHVAAHGVNRTMVFQYADKLVTAGDFNGDRRNDVIMRDKRNGALYLVPGLGAGKFGTPRLMNRGWAPFSSIAVPGDVTGDGRPDVVGVKGQTLYVFSNASGTHLNAVVAKQAVGSTYDVVVGSGRDMTGDGVGDIVVRDGARSVMGVRTGRTRSTFGETLGWFSGAQHWTKVSAGQMAGGTTADFVGVDPTKHDLVVMAHNGLRNVARTYTTNLKLPNASMVLNVGDWNGDGNGDLAVRDTDGDRLVLYPGHGNGTYAKGVVMSSGWKSFVRLAAVGDVTGDKRPDIVGQVADGPVTIFPSAGHAKFQSPILAPSSMQTFNRVGSGPWKPGSMPAASVYGPGGAFVPAGGRHGRISSAWNWIVGPGDVNGDGRNDLIARDADGTLWLLPGTTTWVGTKRYLGSGFGGYSFIG